MLRSVTSRGRGCCFLQCFLLFSFSGLLPVFKWLSARHGNSIQDTLHNDRCIRNFKRLFTSIFLMNSSFVMWTRRCVLCHMRDVRIYVTRLCRRLAFFVSLLFFFLLDDWSVCFVIKTENYKEKWRELSNGHFR